MSVLERERRGAVEVLTLNRPERRNALNKELLAALADAFTELEADDAIRALVLTGAGDRAFCAGMDLKEFAESPRDEQQPDPADDTVVPERHQIVSWEYPKPIVVALNGAAVGGGFEIMMACDLAVAAEHVMFGLAEVKRGLMPGGGGTLLATRIPLSIALEITLIGETFDAARALELGLINRVVAAGQEVDEALVLANRIAENGPLAVRTVKRLVRRCTTQGGDAGWPRPSEIGAVFGSKDALEGAQAFAEKRAPRFVGQ